METTTDVLALLNMDKIVNDLLDILATLDGRVKMLELKSHIKRRPSYLSVVGDTVKQTISDEIKVAQAQQNLDLLAKAVSSISNRVAELEAL